MESWSSFIIASSMSMASISRGGDDGEESRWESESLFDLRKHGRHGMQQFKRHITLLWQNKPITRSRIAKIKVGMPKICLLRDHQWGVEELTLSNLARAGP